MGADHRTVPNFDVVGQAYLSGQYHPVAELTTAGDTDKGRDKAAFADYYIMSNLNEVIYLRSCSYYCIAEFCSVNTAIGSYLDEIFYYDSAVVRYELMRTVDKLIPESRRADCGVCLDYYIVAQAAVMIYDNVAVNPTVFSNF